MNSKDNKQIQKLHPRFNKPLEPRWISQVDGSLLSKANLLQFIRAFFQASEIERGYVLEFGVFNGQSLIETYGILRGLVSDMYGFDSFNGLPDLSEVDNSSLHLTPSFSVGNFKSLPLSQVKDLILASATRLEPDNLHLVEGFFEHTLPKFDKNQLLDKGACLLVHVDCDLYSSSKEVFNFIEDIVVEGTWILLDDYWLYRGSPNHGQRRAFEEWLNSSSRVGVTEYSSYNGFSRAFIVHEKKN